MGNGSILGSYYKTIIEPNKFFHELLEQPNILRPFLIILLSGMALTAATFPHTYKEIQDLFGLGSSLSTAAIVFIILALMICGSALIEWVMLSVFIYFITALLSPASSSFRTVFSVAGFSWVPIILKTLSFAALVLITGKVFQPVGMQILFPNLDNHAVVAMLNQVEPFFIWQFVLLYFGVKVLLKSSSPMTPLLVVVITFAANLALKTIPALMTSFL
ncbi:YIP1 family protein [Siminovitchia sediminis]|uniref:YIP1 family protein n=1 Tax=Siminovitchia sediminis TaxID=1274353 RepID=A0ABW4KLC6_9BACI